MHRGGSGVKPFTVAVNLSGTSLNDERFLEYLIAELSSHELAPGAMCFEITETAAIANLGNVVYFMRELKTRGCHFALDDFGSGLSSFMYLKTLPVDYLKIDGQFVENVTRDPIDRSMVEAISQVGKAMGIHTIAERVESPEVLAELGRLGIGFAQGFHIATPRSTSEFPYLRAALTHPPRAAQRAGGFPFPRWASSLDRPYVKEPDKKETRRDSWNVACRVYAIPRDLERGRHRIGNGGGVRDARTPAACPR